VKVLFVDDEVAGYLPPMRQQLEKLGVELTPASTIEKAQQVISKQDFDLVLLDLHFPDDSMRESKKRGGEVFLEYLHANHPSQAVMVLTTSLQDDHLIPFVSLSHSAHGQYAKPNFRKVDWHTSFFKAMQDCVQTAQDANIDDEQLGFVVGSTEAMKRIKSTLLAVARVPSTVLIYGETGTGKQSVAEALHRLSGRKGQFQKVNCAGLHVETMESEIFGHEKGSYTGAVKTRQGVFELAENGTLFLDEAQKMLPQLQDKLMLALQSKTIRRLGGSDDIAINARIVSAFNTPVEQLVAEDKVRADLVYRLKVVTMHLPPLRERMEDLQQLCSVLVSKLNQKLGKQFGTALRAETLDFLRVQAWPENIRGLENTLEEAMAVHNSNTLLPEHFLNLARAEIQSTPQTQNVEGIAAPESKTASDRIELALQRVLSADRKRWQVFLDGVAKEDRKAVFEALLIHYGKSISRVPNWKDVGRDLFGGVPTDNTLRQTAKGLDVDKETLDYGF
jgi:DNA-binding NtrC family response regulator